MTNNTSGCNCVECPAPACGCGCQDANSQRRTGCSCGDACACGKDCGCARE